MCKAGKRMSLKGVTKQNPSNCRSTLLSIYRDESKKKYSNRPRPHLNVTVLKGSCYLSLTVNIVMKCCCTSGHEVDYMLPPRVYSRLLHTTVMCVSVICAATSLLRDPSGHHCRAPVVSHCICRVHRGS